MKTLKCQLRLLSTKGNSTTRNPWLAGWAEDHPVNTCVNTDAFLLPNFICHYGFCKNKIKHLERSAL